MFFRRSTIKNNTQTTSTSKEYSATMATPMDKSPNEHEQTFIDIATSSFDTEPYDWQYKLGGEVIKAVASNNPFCLLCIRQTGGGKSLLYQVLSLHFKGVTLFVAPILALGSDQMQKILKVPDESLTAFHLDEINDSDLQCLFRHLKNLHSDNTVVLLSSPQFFRRTWETLVANSTSISFNHSCCNGRVTSVSPFWKIIQSSIQVSEIAPFQRTSTPHAHPPNDCNVLGVNRRVF